MKIWKILSFKTTRTIFGFNHFKYFYVYLLRIVLLIHYLIYKHYEGIDDIGVAQMSIFVKVCFIMYEGVLKRFHCTIGFRIER